MPTEEEKSNFKLFKAILMDSKTFPTAAEKFVLQTPDFAKDGSVFSTAIAVVDRAVYNPNKEVNKYLEPPCENCPNVSMDRNVIDRTLNFFRDVKYDVDLWSVNAKKDLNPELRLTGNIDVLAKTEIGLIKHNSSNAIMGAIEYKPFSKEGKLKFAYTDACNNAKAEVYLNKDNPGVTAFGGKSVGANSSVGFGAAVFKMDSNFYLKYKKDNCTVGTYYAPKHNQFGVSAVIVY